MPPPMSAAAALGEYALDFRFSQEQLALRQDVERFIGERMPEELRWCERDAFTDALWPLVTEARRELARLGWTTIHWPAEYGGRDASHVTHTLLVEAMSYCGVPQVIAFDDGPNIIGPVLMRFGTELQKSKHLPSIARAEVFWCQAYTEPGAGSDMAAVATIAERDDDHYVINGHKKFVGGAARADWAHVLARTGQEECRHHNLGYFLVDMRSPGIGLKPIEEAHGRSGMLNEVVFDNVRVPAENLVGGHDEGWQVAMSALDLERSGIENVGRARALLEDVIEYARAARRGGLTLLDDPVVRQQLGEAFVRVEASRLGAYKVAWLRDHGLPVTPQSSMSKMMTSETWQHVTAVALRTLGPDALLLPAAAGAPLRGRMRKRASVHSRRRFTKAPPRSSATSSPSAVLDCPGDGFRSYRRAGIAPLHRPRDAGPRVPESLLKSMAAADDPLPPSAWRALAKNGLLGLTVPKRYGGADLGFTELAVVLEEMGRYLLPGPFLSTMVSGLAVLDSGTEQQQEGLLPAMASGELKRLSPCPNREAPHGVEGVRLRAEPSAGGHHLNGVKTLVSGPAADRLLVVATMSPGGGPADGLSLFVIDARSPGVTVSSLPVMGIDRLFEVTFRDAWAPPNSLLGQAGGGAPLVERLMAWIGIGRCAELVGVAQAALDMTVDYVKRRQAFGRPVGSFQAIQHHCANMLADVESARHLTHQAAWLISNGQYDAPEVSMAQAWTGEAARRVTATAHQCHGAIGFTAELSLHLYHKRA